MPTRRRRTEQGGRRPRSIEEFNVWLVIESGLPESDLGAALDPSVRPDPMTALLDVYASPAQALRAVDELEEQYRPSAVVLAWLREQAE